MSHILSDLPSFGSHDDENDAGRERSASNDRRNWNGFLTLSCGFDRADIDDFLFLAFVLEVTSYMTFQNVSRDAMVVPDELVGQSCTGKVGLRLRKDRLFRPSVHGDG